MLVFIDEAQIVGKGRGDVQVDAAAAGLLAQKIGLHVHVAVAEQDEVDARPLPVEVFQSLGGAGRPIGIGAALGFTAKALDERRRVAAVAGRQDACDVGQFGLGVLLRQYAFEKQRGQAVDQFLFRQTGQLYQGGEVSGQFARRGAKAHDFGDGLVDDEAQMADRVDQQGAAFVEGDFVDELGATQPHWHLF